MAALGENDLYLQHVSVLDTLPAADYVARLPVVLALIGSGGLGFRAPVTVFVGENGVGKSTLVEAIAVACGFNPEGGTANFDFATRESHSVLGDHLRTLKGTRRRRDGFFLRAESFYNVASNIDELDAEPGPGAPVIASYGGVSLHRQSHGESFMALVANRFGGGGLYILDEPEAALSPMRQMELLAHVGRLVDDESQFIISTHSPMLMALPGADVLQITGGGIERVGYRDTQHYQVMRRFLEDPERMLGYLLE